MATIEKYKTAPLECVRKAKEIRANLYKEIAEARQSGKLHVQINAGTTPALFAPFDCVTYDGANYAAYVAKKPGFAARAGAACDAAGFSREMCGYFRNDAGSMYLNEYAYGGEYPKPDIVFDWVACTAQAQWYQVIADRYGIPYFAYEIPYGPFGERIEARSEYLAGQFSEGIAWLEKVTGKPFDDEKFIHGLENVYYCEKVWSEISLLQGSVPVPVPFAALMGLMSIPFALRHEDSCRAFMDEARDEITYRVENQIGASPVERCRLVTDSVPPWHAMQVFNYTEQRYGAVWPSTWIYHLANSLWEELPDGTLIVGKTPNERGIFPKNREEAVRMLAVTELERQDLKPWYAGRDREISLIQFAKQMKADAVALHINRGCPVLSLSVMQTKLALQQAGIPVIGFEGNHADPTDIDIMAVKGTFDGLMGLLGVKPLPDDEQGLE